MEAVCATQDKDIKGLITDLAAANKATAAARAQGPVPGPPPPPPPPPPSQARVSVLAAREAVESAGIVSAAEARLKADLQAARSTITSLRQQLDKAYEAAIMGGGDADGRSGGGDGGGGGSGEVPEEVKKQLREARRAEVGPGWGSCYKNPVAALAADLWHEWTWRPGS